MPIEPDERLAFLYLTVVDNDESRAAIRLMTESLPGVTLLALYDVLGRWDVAVIVALAPDVVLDDYQTAIRRTLIDAEMTASAETRDSGDNTVDEARLREFTAQRAFVVDVSLPVRDLSDSRPKHLLLPTNEEYGLLRIQRSFFFIELQTVAPPRREIFKDRLVDALREARGGFGSIVEALHLSDTAIVLDVVTTCAEKGRLNELNRGIAEVVSRFQAQKNNLIVYFWDEFGWHARSESNR